MAEQAPNVRFTVHIDGAELGSWSKCEGLAIEYEMFEYQEGGLNEFVHRLPGRRKYTNVKLTRPLDSDSAKVAKWMSEQLNSEQVKKVKGQTAQIAVLDPNGQVLCHWDLTGVFPVRWSGPTLDAGGNQVAIETLELSHNGFLEAG